MTRVTGHEIAEIPADFPAKIQIQTHTLCNYACPMCPYPETRGARSKTRLDEVVFDRVLAELAARDRTVELCIMLQNEPLMDPRLPALARRAHDSPHVRFVATVTNGSLLDHAIMDELTAMPRFALTVSVNAVDPRRYLRMHGRDRWERVHDVLTTWAGDRTRVVLSCVVGADAPEEARRFRDFWHAHGYRTRILPMNDRAGTAGNDDALHRVDASFGHCRYPIDTLTVTASGDVILCCQDWSHERSFGNLRDLSIAAIWNDSPLADIRRASLAGDIRSVPQCKGCDYPMRSAERLALEERLDGASRPGPSKPDTTRPHLSWIRRDRRDNPVAVHAVDEDGSALVFSNTELAAGDAEVVVPLAYGDGHATHVRCRAELAPAPMAGRLHAYRVRASAADPRFRFWKWYANDWRRP